jgi:hypothetical protein
MSPGERLLVVESVCVDSIAYSERRESPVAPGVLSDRSCGGGVVSRPGEATVALRAAVTGLCWPAALARALCTLSASYPLLLAVVVVVTAVRDTATEETSVCTVSVDRAKPDRCPVVRSGAEGSVATAWASKPELAVCAVLLLVFLAEK